MVILLGGRRGRRYFDEYPDILPESITTCGGHFASSARRRSEASAKALGVKGKDNTRAASLLDAFLVLSQGQTPCFRIAFRSAANLSWMGMLRIMEADQHPAVEEKLDSRP